MRKRWEYKRVLFDSSDHSVDGQLNRLGRDGWELVHYRYIAEHGRSIYEGMFKRETEVSNADR